MSKQLLRIVHRIREVASVSDTNTGCFRTNECLKAHLLKQSTLDM